MASESIYGVWWTPGQPDKKVTGQLTWEPPRSPTLEVLEPRGSFGAFDSDEAMIVGDVARFGWMTLLNCKYGGGQVGGLTPTRKLRVGQAISRVHLNDQSDRLFRRVEIDAPALALLLGAYPIREKTRLSGRSREARLTLEDRRCTWKAEGVEVQAWYCWRKTPDELGVDLRMVPQVQLSSATSRPLGYWFDEWLEPLNVFLQVATARPFHPRSVSLWTKKRITPMERASDALHVWAAGIDPDAVVDFRPADVRLSHPLLSIEELEDASIHDVLNRTKRFANDHEVFVSLLSFVLSETERSMHNRYLDVIAALEAYDSRKHGVGPLDIVQYKAQRKSALEAVGDPVAKKFLKRWVPGRSAFSLEDRLQRSAEATGVATWEIDAKTMAKVRNDIAHGNAHPDGYLLRKCFAQALEVARKLALAEMGLG
jgi:hypothetical protein